MRYVRKRLRLNTQSAREFVRELNKSKDNSLWHIEDKNGEQTINARSLLGMVYAADSWKQIYLVNDTLNGEYPEFMKKYFYLK